ncbi:FAD/NAD(P)-binding protein [Bacillus thuringiensis]|uniref:FAD/NAD(P)-binding protein n=1 Tax=Bacillus thuringiensis TaxID=1428 RepID=UPI000D0409DE|nr:FAD/NAD(P)-binding protein [Bacillus thuringiensis]PRT22646.1 hypothetical protein C6351_31465 [Bacillus thuringiensis]
MKIAIVGLGPRGISVFERIVSNILSELKSESYEFFLVDPHPPGGAVWRTDQSPQLLMNTVASQITLFTDDSVQCRGPIVNGPSLLEWANELRDKIDTLDMPTVITEEIYSLEPNSYPTRALYGYYLKDSFNTILEELPSNIKINLIQDTLINLYPNNEDYTLFLTKSLTPIKAEKVIFTTGHSDQKLTSAEEHFFEFANSNNLNYFPPSNPADVNLDSIEPKTPVIIRGLGLNFFDYMSLLTSGRDGKFEEINDKLNYIPSGKEPLLIAGSRRGLPYHSRGQNQKGSSERHIPLFLKNEVIEQLKHKNNLSFKKEIWPFVKLEVESIYYTTLIRNLYGIEKSCQFLYEFVNCAIEYHKDLLINFGVKSELFFDWHKISCPYGDKKFNSITDFHNWLDTYLHNDINEANLGNKNSPLKAALDVLRDIRNEIRILVDHGGINAESYKEELRNWYTPLNAFLSIGPPVQRIKELRALIRAGILVLVGPEATVATSPINKDFKISSNRVKDSIFHAKNLIDARLPSVNINQSKNILISNMLKAGLASEFKIATNNNYIFESGGLAVTPPPNRLIDKNGKVNPNLYSFGIPTEGVHWVTAAGARPGVNSVTLLESDSIARDVLGCNITINNVYKQTIS